MIFGRVGGCEFSIYNIYSYSSLPGLIWGFQKEDVIEIFFSNSGAGGMLQVFLNIVHMFCLGGKIGVMHSIVLEIVPPKP